MWSAWNHRLSVAPGEGSRSVRYTQVGGIQLPRRRGVEKEHIQPKAAAGWEAVRRLGADVDGSVLGRTTFR